MENTSMKNQPFNENELKNLSPDVLICLILYFIVLIKRNNRKRER